MLMSDDDKKKYGDFMQWLRDDLPLLPIKKPKVWRAFQKYAGILAHTFWPGQLTPMFLLWGFSPRIEVREWDCVKDGEPVPKSPNSDILVQKYKIKRSGFTSPDGSIILVAGDLAREPYDKTRGPVLEATVLHELVHWCRWGAGKDVYDEGPPYDFEREAYGRIMVRTWESCYSPEMYIPKDRK